MPPYVVTKVHTAIWLKPDMNVTNSRELTGPKRSAMKPMTVRPTAAAKFRTVMVKAAFYMAVSVRIPKTSADNAQNP